MHDSLKESLDLRTGDSYKFGLLLYLIDNGCENKIKIIKLWRSLMGTSLKEAKEFMEGLVPQYLREAAQYSNDYQLTGLSRNFMDIFLEENPDIDNYAKSLIAEQLLMTGKSSLSLSRFMEDIVREFTQPRSYA